MLASTPYTDTRMHTLRLASGVLGHYGSTGRLHVTKCVARPYVFAQRRVQYNGRAGKLLKNTRFVHTPPILTSEWGGCAKFAVSSFAKVSPDF
jgi:hypothetical protein